MKASSRERKVEMNMNKDMDMKMVTVMEMTMHGQCNAVGGGEGGRNKLG